MITKLVNFLKLCAESEILIYHNNPQIFYNNIIENRQNQVEPPASEALKSSDG